MRDSRGRFIKGHKPTEEMIQKDRAYHTGKKHTAATKAKISSSKMGTVAWNKGIKAKDHPGLQKSLEAAHASMKGASPGTKERNSRQSKVIKIQVGKVE